MDVDESTALTAVCACGPKKSGACPVHDSGMPVDESDWWTGATSREVYRLYLEAGFTHAECTSLLSAWIRGRIEGGRASVVTEPVAQ